MLIFFLFWDMRSKQSFVDRFWIRLIESLYITSSTIMQEKRKLVWELDYSFWYKGIRLEKYLFEVEKVFILNPWSFGSRLVSAKILSYICSCIWRMSYTASFSCWCFASCLLQLVERLADAIDSGSRDQQYEALVNLCLSSPYGSSNFNKLEIFLHVLWFIFFKMVDDKPITWLYIEFFVHLVIWLSN